MFQQSLLCTVRSIALFVLNVTEARRNKLAYPFQFTVLHRIINSFHSLCLVLFSVNPQACQSVKQLSNLQYMFPSTLRCMYILCVYMQTFHEWE